ncbi:UNVERIFIED_CONTAM: Retrovirus-related Pol polyprotein from transposon RE1 [Sesamum radiatum]|uniref:Retrovirus-related Pol polyprotein from transposon RE1 n=1 Tax=Sesamum radiatum TaxID=300843 RepID=A0AAW2K924_SESRA
MGSSLEDIWLVKRYLHELFTIKDIGDAWYFLGLDIARNSEGCYLAQTKYVLDIIKDTGFMDAKAVSTPFPQGLKLSNDCGALLQNPDQCRRLVGCLLYLSFTHPDISHCVQQLSQFLNHPCQLHLSAAMHVVRYLKGCPSKGKALVSWQTKKQSTVSRSTVEAEYYSASIGCLLHPFIQVRPGVVRPQSYLWGAVGIGGVDDADIVQQINEKTEHAATAVAGKQLITWLDSG